MEKKCTKCGEVKSLDEFHNNKTGKHHKRSKCKVCCKEYQQERNKYKKDNISTIEFIKIFQQNHGLRECNKCKVVKVLNEFYDKKTGKYLKDSRCKICITEAMKDCYKNNKPKHIRISKEYYLKNKEKIKESRKEYNISNREKRNKYAENYRKNNKEKIYKAHRLYSIKNKDKVTEWARKSAKLNKVKRNKNHSLRRETDRLFRLTGNIRSGIRSSLKKQGYSKKTKTYNILKCDFNFFMKWINSIASNGHTYGIGDLHLDHVVPISLAETEDEAYLLNHYSNYQLLSADENLAKSNRYVNPTNLKRVLEHHPEPNKIKEIYSRL